MKSKKTLLLEFSKANNIDFNIVLKYYAFERLLFRISKSNYNNNLILKGGFFLFTYTKAYQRVTRDIDFSLLNNDLTVSNVKRIINDLISIKIKDDISFSINDIDLIRINDEYYGLRIKLSYNFYGILDVIHIDLATGDIITPNPLQIKYTSFINNESFYITSYNIETFISEKLETIFSKLENNSRMKDFYDIYLLDKIYRHAINKKILNRAIKNTLTNRKYDNDINESILILKNSNILKRYWSMYRIKNKYARNIEYEEIVDTIYKYVLYSKKNYKNASFTLSFV